MSKICNSLELHEILRSGDAVYVLFYAAWCPFSQAFLPVYERHAAGREREFVRIVLDGNETLFDQHEIKVYPTVLYFKKGAVARRLDGRHLAGLEEKQLADLISTCEKDRD